jgi:5S rRNA maturation endonuclease (ribonuclease M5)
MFLKKSTRDAIKSVLEKLNIKATEAVFVIEGKKDEAALKHLVDADFFLLNHSKRSLYESAETIASKYKEAVLMLDADKKGIELKEKMKSYLQQNGVRVHIENKLLKLARCRNVENLRSLEL